ncbi:hypothetical protein [Halomarina ordinaria]|uniref:Carboxypeptidase regulatory-like domain-containing protein n=1 Tax=Halomarina ordinaria TaxID=3033939 RepID=A0ABD5UDS6_9EURY|nr:hypothetical protein [Halomarina sp. PSRA2]
MRRRVLLSALGLTAVAPGCLDRGRGGGGAVDGDENRTNRGTDRTVNGTDGAENGSDSTENGTDGAGNESAGDGARYEECGHLVVHYVSLPDPMVAEFDAAREDGRYETEGRSHLADGLREEAYVVYQDRHYAHEVNERELTVLEVEPDSNPTLPEAKSARFVNERGSPATVRVTDEDGETRFETTLEGGDEASHDETELGGYTVTVVVDGEETTERWRVAPWYGDPDVRITGDGVDWLQSVADVAPCPWAV